jgi:hypothetical protein
MIFVGNEFFFTRNVPNAHPVVIRTRKKMNSVCQEFGYMDGTIIRTSKH